jgi:hypothetical protein
MAFTFLFLDGYSRMRRSLMLTKTEYIPTPIVTMVKKWSSFCCITLPLDAILDPLPITEYITIFLSSDCFAHMATFSIVWPLASITSHLPHPVMLAIATIKKPNSKRILTKIAIQTAAVIVLEVYDAILGVFILSSTPSRAFTSRGTPLNRLSHAHVHAYLLAAHVHVTPCLVRNLFFMIVLPIFSFRDRLFAFTTSKYTGRASQDGKQKCRGFDMEIKKHGCFLAG